TLVFETTGASKYFASLASEFRTQYNVRLVRVLAPKDICAERIRARNQEQQIPVSEDTIEKMFSLSTALDLPWALELNNHPYLDGSAIRPKIFPLIGRT